MTKSLISLKLVNDFDSKQRQLRQHVKRRTSHTKEAARTVAYGMTVTPDQIDTTSDDDIETLRPVQGATGYGHDEDSRAGCTIAVRRSGQLPIPPENQPKLVAYPKVYPFVNNALCSATWEL